MDTEQLTSYVATERARGVADAGIKTQLLTTGWKEADVNAALGITVTTSTFEVSRKFALNKLDVGRISRIQYFLALMLLIVICLAAVLLMSMLGGVMGMGNGNSLGIVLLIIPVLCFYLALFIFSMFLGVRRLHDINLSGWFYLVCLIPGIGFLFGLFVLFMPGTAGLNKYGNPPDFKRSIWKTLINT